MTGRQQTIVLYDDGDVTLVVGEADGIQQPILASKTAMSLASPVWKAMFSRAWAEHEASEVPLPDDDIEATLLVLRIAHLRFQDLPKKSQFTLSRLLNLAVVCNKFDLVDLVEPFLNLQKWALSWLPIEIIEEDYEPDLLFIAWAFGYGESFEILAEHFTMRLGVEADGTPLFSGQQLPKHMPPGLLENMLEVREDAITRILKVAYRTLDQILKGPVCKQIPPSEAKCRCIILGSYTSFLIANDLYPQYKKATDVTMSLQEFSTMFGTLNLLTHVSHDYSAIYKQAKQTVHRIHGEVTSSAIKSHLIGTGLREHKSCGRVVDINMEAYRICGSMSFPSLGKFPTHMSDRAEKQT